MFVRTGHQVIGVTVYDVHLGLIMGLCDHVQVNTLSPGLTDTEIWNNMPAEVKKKMLEVRSNEERGLMAKP